MREEGLKCSCSTSAFALWCWFKGKLLQAMVCGTPSVTTNIGAEAVWEFSMEWFY
jgi:glycosyltransferase involved in cell wall biosynthesis